MGWGVRYKYTGYLSRLHKDSLYAERDELQNVNDLLWREILAYMAATPPATIGDCEGNPLPYPEHLSIEVAKLREQIEENLVMITKIDQCLEVMNDSPDDVVED